VNPASPGSPSSPEPSDTGHNPYDASAGQQSAPPATGPAVDAPPVTGLPVTGPPPPGWAPGHPGYPAYQMRRPTNSMAIAAMITGIVALFSCQLIGLVAVYLAKRAREEIQVSGEEGAGFATAGLILGWVGVALSALLVVLMIAYFGFIGVMIASTS